MNTSDSISTMETASSAGTITTLESLREHLQWALELEHSTIPPYLCALYSIKAGHNTEAIEVLNSILVEEMLHLTLAANLLNAVGGQPRLDTPQMLQSYPGPLPHSADSFEVSLLRFSPEALETFLKIEQPSSRRGSAEGNHYETIGQFYEAIEQGFRDLSASLGESNVFCGDPARQITNHPFYSGGGSIVAVNDLASALTALAEIIEQGEGAGHTQVWDGDSDVFHPERDQVAHYYRFQELKLGRRYCRGDTPRSGPTGEPVVVDWNAVHPMRANPKSSDHLAGTPARLAQEEFNRSYCTLLQLLEQVFNGAPQMLGNAFGGMYTLKSQAQNLMQMPNEDGGTTAGPSFEYVAPELRTAIVQQSQPVSRGGLSG
ncbi:ferritin-like domain-containing protein [Terriglobus albidus]|uniref:ferritin-like domain-containing protein n=1 Tax=Terriglobus albidus TaxID=1592106 RepID=UPI0021E0F277|nr:ferritin-like protein [Terriglobus albidus]